MSKRARDLSAGELYRQHIHRSYSSSTFLEFFTSLCKHHIWISRRNIRHTSKVKHFTAVTRHSVMVSSVPLQSQQVALPQAHGPGAVPDSTLMSRQNHVFDLQLTVLQSRETAINIVLKVI